MSPEQERPVRAQPAVTFSVTSLTPNWLTGAATKSIVDAATGVPAAMVVMSMSDGTFVPVPSKSKAPTPPTVVLRTMSEASLVLVKVQVTFSPAPMSMRKVVSPASKPAPPLPR